MMTSQLRSDFDVSIYNNLLDVDDADQIVQSSGHFDAFFDKAEEVVLAHNMEERFGLCLLHRHNRCSDEEWMVESAEAYDEEPALVTRPVAESPKAQSAVPTVWQLVDGDYMPLEFSNDVLAKQLLADDRVPAAFLDDFADIARNSPIGACLGLGVVRRQFYADNKADETPLEYSHLIPRSNVILMREDSEITEATIPTAWIFRREPTLGCRKINCKPPECVKKCADHSDLPRHHAPGGHKNSHLIEM